MVDVSNGEDQGPIKKVLKVLVVGEMGTGKTSLIRQYVQGFFSEFYKTTIGVDFATKEIEWDEKITISLQLWDIAGQERYGNMTRVYYQEAVAAFVVFDVTRLQSLDMVKEWKKDLDSKVFTSEEQPIPCLLLGNKIDLCNEGKWTKTPEEMEEFCKENKFLKFFETSARSRTNVEEAARYLVKYIMDNKIEASSAKNQETVDLTKPADKKDKDSGCCK